MEMSVSRSNHSLRPITDADWPRLESLWLALYEHQQSHGMLLELPPNAYQLWADSFRPLMERFGFVFVAEEAHALVGFFAGKIRTLPPHFGGYQVGYFTELFVIETHRGRGIADELLTAGINWFREREIVRLELQVVSNNEQARSFYLRRGWVEELTQMVLR